MAPSKKTYKGCRDFYPKNMRVRESLFSKMKLSAEAFAYEPYDGPLLEEVELYRAKSGEELINDQIYSFIDRGKREVAIRPEMTPTLARMVANIHKEASKPLRWYSIPNLMRYEKPQRGRVREHWQFNVDIFGAKANLGEFEILNLIIHFFKSFGATEEMFEILLNDRRVVDSIFHDLLKLDSESSYKLYKVIDKAKKVTPEKLKTMISEIIFDSEKQKLFSKYLEINSFKALQDFVATHKISDSCEEFMLFISMIESLPNSSFIKYDPTIVRGLDYYTGIVFEVFDKHPDNKRAIAGGGAYANLLQIFNESALSGVGFGLGDVTLKDFLESHHLLGDFSKPENDLIIYYVEDAHESRAINLANKLREHPLKVESYLGTIKFNKIIKHAGSKGHNIVGIIESDNSEIKIQIKNLQTRENTFFKIDEVTEILNFIK